MDKDGYISNGELFQVLKMMVGNNLKDTQLQQIVDKTIINADKDGDGRISFEEFCAVSDVLLILILKKTQPKTNFLTLFWVSGIIKHFLSLNQNISYKKDVKLWVWVCVCVFLGRGSELASPVVNFLCQWVFNHGEGKICQLF